MLDSALNEQQREQLLLEHLPQVHYVARRIHFRLPPQVPLEDLVHAGILGLMDAVKKYDPTKNVRLKHYAEFRIRGAILDSLRLVDWSPRALRRQARRLAQAVSQIRTRLSRDPSEEEIAAELNVGLEDLQRLRAMLRGLDLGSVQTQSSDQSGEEEIEHCESKEEDPYHQALRSEMAELLARAMNELPQRQREVLSLYHFQDLTMKEVGRILSIGESRVSQIHSAALLRLRTRLPKLLSRARPSNLGTSAASPTIRRKTALA
ncbi:MAG TPA: FliA/WhiG family RNA polymerase sigma factor [Candidatus Acidoferrales bacterium]|nr:FliA/WhiG family RNA polymerase sigma factor [Candidatus Acidoferrales bacterium]